MTGQLNINQFALPGMEEHAHAGAQALSKGLYFEHKRESVNDPFDPGLHRLSMKVPMGRRDLEVGSLRWLGSNYPVEPDMHGYNAYAGEIQGVSTQTAYRRQGVASTLYNMATDPNVHTGEDTTPLHSGARTHEGLKWSAAVGGWDPDKDALEDRPRHPFEEREEQTAKRRPQLRGQGQMFSVGQDW